MSEKAYHALEWAQALYAEGYIGQAYAHINTAIAATTTGNNELWEAWLSFLQTV
jgi:hypothetical protein